MLGDYSLNVLTFMTVFAPRITKLFSLQNRGLMTQFTVSTCCLIRIQFFKWIGTFRASNLSGGGDVFIGVKIIQSSVSNVDGIFAEAN